ncbi:MAG: DUF4198 domain-containing protein, partial [Chitinophagaceae bacterium]
MMKQFFLTLLFFFSSSILLFSHEFWLHPTKFIYEPGELITIKLLVGENYEGENYEGENWSGTNKSIENLQLHFPGTTDELSEKIGETPGDSLQFSIHDEGTYLLSYHSTNKFIELDPKKFNEYLNEDGLQNTIDYRLAHHETDSVGREYYQRSVKTI